MNGPGVGGSEAQDPLFIGRTGQEFEGTGTQPFDPVDLAFEEPVSWKGVFPAQGIDTLLVKLLHLVGMLVFELSLVVEGVAVEEIHHGGIQGDLRFRRKIAGQQAEPVINEGEVGLPGLLLADHLLLEPNHVALSGDHQIVCRADEGIAHFGLVGSQVEGGMGSGNIRDGRGGSEVAG